VCEPGTWHGYLNDFSQAAAARTVARFTDWIVGNLHRTRAR